MTDWKYIDWQEKVTDWKYVEWQEKVANWKYVEWEEQNSVHPDLKNRFHPRFALTKCGLMLLELIRNYFGHQSLLF